MASYRVVFLQELATQVVGLSDTDQVYLFAEVGPMLGRDPHSHGDLWMTLDTEHWYVLSIGAASLTYAVDDDAQTVTVTSITLPGRGQLDG